MSEYFYVPSGCLRCNKPLTSVLDFKNGVCSACWTAVFDDNNSDEIDEDSET